MLSPRVSWSELGIVLTMLSGVAAAVLAVVNTLGFR
jgi:hypothetical protein